MYALVPCYNFILFSLKVQGLVLATHPWVSSLTVAKTLCRSQGQQRWRVAVLACQAAPGGKHQGQSLELALAAEPVSHSALSA